jgi:hypothetical protein
MPARKRSSTASAIALTTAGAALLLTGCGATGTAKAQGAPSGTATASGPAQPGSGATAQPTAQPTSRPTPAPKPSASSSSSSGSSGSAGSTAPVLGSPASVRNGTGGSGLTISDGTDYVVMNGTRVDFGTIVRDLSWNPAGTRAAFIDGSGDLVVADPDGSGQVVVARNPGNQVWSHPVWALAPTDYTDATTHVTTSLYFAATVDGVSRLEAVAAGAVHGTPAVVSIQSPSGNVPEVPSTGNAWPSGGGAQTPDIAYANSGDGEVYIRDTFLRQQSSPAVLGSEPALSPNEDDLVFVRSVDGHDHLFEQVQQAVKDLTPDATTDYTEPAWSPDGRTIAARTPDGIVTLAADGVGAPVLVSGYSGLPAYRG